MRKRFIAAVLCMLAAMPASALEVMEVHSTSIKKGERITIQFSQNVATEVFTTKDAPPRIVIDMPVARWKSNRKDFTSKLIKSVRLAFHDAESSRMVLDLNQEVTLRNVKMAGSRKKGYQLEIEAVTGKKTEQQAAPKQEQFRPSEKPVIVIDAGHGGQDPGASGIGGVKEKRITLKFAEALKAALLKSGRYRVAMTRSDDRYLFLRERVKIARSAKGSLFISLHADSAPSRSAQGLSIYTISEHASDKEAEALAAKENKADVIGGMDLSGTSQDVADILIELTERETRGKSTEFAKLAMRSLGREVELLSNTHRQAGFAVLKAPDIPSILVEVGFLSSPQEERLLESDSYRQKVARGLASAVDAYFAKRK